MESVGCFSSVSPLVFRYSVLRKSLMYSNGKQWIISHVCGAKMVLGKHKGRLFSEVAENDVDYCNMVPASKNSAI